MILLDKYLSNKIIFYSMFSKIFSFSFILIISIALFISGPSFAFESKHKIPSLAQRIKVILPPTWILTEEGATLHIKNSEPFWVLFENRINAPMSAYELNEVQLEDKIKGGGKRVYYEFSLRSEPRWSDEKIKLSGKTKSNLLPNFNTKEVSIFISDANKTYDDVSLWQVWPQDVFQIVDEIKQQIQDALTDT